MELVLVLLAFLAGAGMATGLMSWRAERRLDAAEEMLRELIAERAALRARLEGVDGLRASITAAAADGLRGSQESFLTLANQVFERHHSRAREELAPIRAALAELERARLDAQGALRQEVQSLAGTTARLVNALRSAPKTRGRWGEQSLQNVLELSGLSSHVDFALEATLKGEDDRVRPDAIIRLPGGRSLVVDAKTPLVAYLDAVEAADEPARERHLAAHAAQLRAHARQLGAKAYWSRLPETPDFVVMFVPGESFFAAAAERDPDLFEAAVAERVLIATPITLMAMAKAVAFGWRQERTAETAREVHALGQELYQRLARMGGHVEQMGAGLRQAVARYNEFVGSLESKVLPQARRFRDLGLEGTGEPLPEPTRIETEPRAPTPGRDLALPA